MYRLVSNKSIGQLSEISLKNVISFRKFNSEFSYNETWFTDQNSKPLDIEDKINLTLVVNWCLTYEMRYTIESRDLIHVKVSGILSLAKNTG